MKVTGGYFNTNDDNFIIKSESNENNYIVFIYLRYSNSQVHPAHGFTVISVVHENERNPSKDCEPK